VAHASQAMSNLSFPRWMEIFGITDIDSDREFGIGQALVSNRAAAHCGRRSNISLGGRPDRRRHGLGFEPDRE
jgi:hypothetical protein